jgi:hypothetical protein
MTTRELNKGELIVQVTMALSSTNAWHLDRLVRLVRGGVATVRSYCRSRRWEEGRGETPRHAIVFSEGRQTPENGRILRC